MRAKASNNDVIVHVIYWRLNGFQCLLFFKIWSMEAKGCCPGKSQSGSLFWRRLSQQWEKVTRVLESMSQTACGQGPSLLSHNPPWLNIGAPSKLRIWCSTLPTGWRWQFNQQGSYVQSPFCAILTGKRIDYFSFLLSKHWLQVCANYVFKWIKIGRKYKWKTFDSSGWHDLKFSYFDFIFFQLCPKGIWDACKYTLTRFFEIIIFKSLRGENCYRI